MSDNLFHGIVKGAEFAQVLPGVDVTLLDNQHNELDKTTTDSYGAWSLSAEKGGASILFSRSGYVSRSVPVDNIPELVRMLEDRLIGYQDRLWFYPGEEIPVYVHSPAPYSATLFRHGIVKQKIHTLQNLSSQKQEIPNEVFVESGLAWERSFSHCIPEDARPGLYSLLLESGGQDSFAIPLIVSTPKKDLGKNSVLVLASTSTWLAYNIWGGRSRYLNYEENTNSDPGEAASLPSVRSIVRAVKKILPFGVVVLLRKYFNTNREQIFPWMFKPLSIRRPFTNCDLESDSWEQPFTNHLAGGEWRILAWLEKMNCSYDIVSGWELNNDPTVLDGYKSLLLSTHCEYWSCEMFRKVKHYHENSGLWILNLSGNTMYREIQFHDDGSLKCVSASFKDSCSDESRLTGVRFTDYDYATCAPFKVVNHSHWVFNDSGVSGNGQLFGNYSLNQHTVSLETKPDPGRPAQGGGLVGQGASGWETDKLSLTAPGDFCLVATGINSYGGADMVIREPEGSRGGIFSAPSIVFGGSLAVDPVCSKIVENVLNKCLKK